MAESVQGEGVKFNSSKSTAQAKLSTEKGTIHFTKDGEIFVNKTRYSGVKEIAIGTTIQTIGDTGRVTLPAYPTTLPANGGNADTVDGKHASDFVAANSAITGATKCKVTYDSKGLVTGGADLASTDIPNLDASKITSGTFADARIASANKWNGKQDALSFMSTPSSTNPVATQTEIGTRAPLASPALTGTPTAPTAAAGTNTTQIATTAFVKSAVDALLGTADALTYEGTLTPNSNKQIITPAANKGNVYKVTAAGTFCGTNVENGDMFICNTDNTHALVVNSNESTVSNNWDIIQKNVDGAVIGPSSSTAEHVAVFAGGDGKTIKDSNYTIGTSVPSGAVFTDTKVTSVDNHYTPSENTGSALNAGNASVTNITNGNGVQVITGIKRDAKGHVVGVVSAGLKSTNTDTHDTNVAGTGISVSGTRGSTISLSQDTLETLACLTWD